MQPILVHGGGKADQPGDGTAGLVPQMCRGGGIPTSARSRSRACACNQINKFIVTFIQAQGCEAMGLHSLSSNVLFAEKTYLPGSMAAASIGHGP